MWSSSKKEKEKVFKEFDELNGKIQYQVLNANKRLKSKRKVKFNKDWKALFEEWHVLKTQRRFGIIKKPNRDSEK